MGKGGSLSSSAKRSRTAREQAELALTPAERLTLALELSDLCADLAAAGRSALHAKNRRPAPDSRQIEVMDPAMVPVLRRKTPAERLQNSFAIWESARSMLQAHLSHTHRDWTPEQVRREVAHRMSHGTV